MSADEKLLRAQMRREDLEDEVRAIEDEIAAVRERGRDTMDILAPEDNARLRKLLSDQDRTKQELSEARSNERFQRKLAEQPRAPELAKPSLTEWKRERDTTRSEHSPGDLEHAREHDLDRDR